jgi:F plasmid transfer operon, TraF, protein
MCVSKTGFGLFCAFFLLFSSQGSAQGDDGVGTRAQGLGGAFVGVADDASAVYWNPGGLAGGAYFSLVLDGSTGEAAPDDLNVAGSRSAYLLALSTPAVGLSYYRLHHVTAAPSSAGGASAFRLDSLTTQHVGATLVHSLFAGIAVGATLKAVRALAGTADVPANDAEDAVENWDVAGHKSSTADLDIGVMARSSAGGLGLLIRNVTEPSFETGNGTELALDRQIRIGGSVLLLPTWKLAADVDLTTTRAAFAERREFAIGTEGQVTKRVAARAGMRLNTTGDLGRTPSYSVGGSFALMGSLQLDAQFTSGSDKAFSSWGLAGRMVF